jgi:hypothetical protein
MSRIQTCLINAPTGVEFSDHTEINLPNLRAVAGEPQLGILNLASVLEAAGGVPSIVDLNRTFYAYADDQDVACLDEFAHVAAQRIAAIDADVYGFGSICSAYPVSLRIAQQVKVLRPESVILFGGPQASVVSQETLAAFPFVDFILRGEAEESLPIFLEEFTGGRKFERVPGLTHRSIWGIQKNPDAALILDLDGLPSPAYGMTGELRGHKQASLELGRGCPFACTFCSTNDFFRRKFRLRSPQRVLQEMRSIHAEYGITDFGLVHDMFTVDAKRVRNFCHTLLEAGEGYTWGCSARTDCVDEEMIELMAAAGCVSMFFGVETGSDRMQKIIDKHLNVKRAHQIIDIAEKAGIHSTISLITGFPEETMDDLRDTVDMFMHSARTPRSGPQLNLLSPLAKTPLHLQFKDQLTLDSLCSDISHQGRRQNPEDMELIRRYPDIFPNFYLVPSPGLDRAFVLELREFTLVAEARFRWLLGAIHQATSGVLDVFTQWLETRQQLYPGLAGPDLRHYYRTPQFAADFLSFLTLQTCSRSPLVAALLNFEQAILVADSPEELSTQQVKRLVEDEDPAESDLPVRNDQSRVIEVDCDLSHAIEAVRAGEHFERTREARFYVVPQAAGSPKEVSHVSRRMAKVVEACDGRKTVKQVIQHLVEELSEIPPSWRNQFCVELLGKARGTGLVAIYRRVSRADASQVGGDCNSEYSVTSAAASRQNQSLSHAE